MTLFLEVDPLRKTQKNFLIPLDNRRGKVLNISQKYIKKIQEIIRENGFSCKQIFFRAQHSFCYQFRVLGFLYFLSDLIAFAVPFLLNFHGIRMLVGVYLNIIFTGIWRWNWKYFSSGNKVEEILEQSTHNNHKNIFTILGKCGFLSIKLV